MTAGGPLPVERRCSGIVIAATSRRTREAVGVGDAGEGAERVVGLELARGRALGGRRVESTTRPGVGVALRRGQVEPDREGIAGRRARTPPRARARSSSVGASSSNRSMVTASSPVFSKRTTRRRASTSRRPCWRRDLESVGQRRRSGRAPRRRAAPRRRGRRRARASGAVGAGRAASGSSGHRTETSRRRPPSERGGRRGARRPPRSRVRRDRRAPRRRRACPASPPWRSAMLSGTLASSGTGRRRPPTRGARRRPAPPPAPNSSTTPSGPANPAMFSTDADDRAGRSGARRRPALGDVGRGGLRGRDDDDLGVRQQLAERDRDVARAGRQVDEQHVEVAEVHVGEELLQRAVQHRAAPRDGDR